MRNVSNIIQNETTKIFNELTKIINVYLNILKELTNLKLDPLQRMRLEHQQLIISTYIQTTIIYHK